jgi:hypothetical protein
MRIVALLLASISVVQVSVAAEGVIQPEAVNRPGFPGDSYMREDGVYGNSEAVFGGSAGAGCPASA